MLNGCILDQMWRSDDVERGESKESIQHQILTDEKEAGREKTHRGFFITTTCGRAVTKSWRHIPVT